MINIGLNITQNKVRYEIFLNQIKKGLKDYQQCTFIDVSHPDLLDKHISKLNILLTYGINQNSFKLVNDQLKWIHFGVAGVEESLFPDLIKSKVMLSNCSGIHVGPVSEFIMGAILYHCKRFDACHDFKNTQNWKQWDIAKTMIQLKNKTLGIIGYGQIGKSTAQKAKQFGMNVIATRRLQKNVTSSRFVDQLIPVSEIKTLYQESDFIAITCPLTPLTRGMISDNEFALMKNNAYLINIARGPIINEDSMVKALESDQISGAALDVFDKEPLPPKHPYFKFKNLFLSPHISGNFPEYQYDMIEQFIDNLKRFLNGKAIKNRICKKRLY